MPISSSVFRRIAQRTGGKAYWARTWQQQVEASKTFARTWATPIPSPTIPRPNPNEGFRKIAVEIVSDPGKKYRVHSRPGYRPSRVWRPPVRPPRNSFRREIRWGAWAASRARG